LLVTSYKLSSVYDHVHLVTGHPNPTAKSWHQKNSINAGYTPKDAAVSRPVCFSYVYGAMHLTRTDRYRQHRPKPTVSGQQFSLDAYTHTRPSFRRNLYCDLLADLATGRIYPLYTKDRSALELVDKLSIFFALHL
jgi:hypothetical protein